MEKKDYVVSFKENGVVITAKFNPGGEWMETMTVINGSDLPDKVLTSIAPNFVGFKISEVSKVETSEKITYFEMYLKTDKEGYDVEFSPTGDVLKKTKLKN